MCYHTFPEAAAGKDSYGESIENLHSQIYLFLLRPAIK